MIQAQLVRGVCLVLCFVAGGVTVNLLLHHEAALGIKVGWIATILFLMGLAPQKMPFFTRNAGTCLFYRNAFGGVFVILLLASLFVLFWIQLPRERVPRFRGKVVEVMTRLGVIIPRVEFQDIMGKQSTFDDALATTIFPKRQFIVGEQVVVRAPTNGAPPHIDHSALARWGPAIILFLITLIASVLSYLFHMRYLSLVH
jgi:hypothetical protein